MIARLTDRPLISIHAAFHRTTPCPQNLSAKPAQVAAAIALLDEGATVPFIARYRKEATGGLDDIQLRLLEERLRYLRELEDRRAAIVASITRPEQDDAGPASTPITHRRRQDAPGRSISAV